MKRVVLGRLQDSIRVSRGANSGSDISVSTRFSLEKDQFNFQSRNFCWLSSDLKRF